MLLNQRKDEHHPIQYLPTAYLDRPRLYQEALRRAPRVLLLLGLKGSGKTLAAQQYLAHVAEPVISIELQPHKGHEWAALPAALRRAGLAAAHPQAALSSLRERTVVLIDRLELGLDASGAPSATTAYWLSELIAHPFVSVVLASRVTPAFDDLLMLLADGQAQIIDGDALAFTPSEVQALWRSRRGTELSAQLADELVARSGGLATVVALACATGTMSADPVSFGDSLVAQVLSSLPRELHELLINIAVLDAVTPAALAAFASQSDGNYVFHLLRQYGVLTSHVPPQIHPLIRHALLEKLQTQRHRLVRMTRRAVDLALADGAYQQAWHVAEGTRCWECARDVIVAAARALHAQGAWAQLVEWVQRLPDSYQDQAILEILARCQKELGDLDGALLTLTRLKATATEPAQQQEYSIRLATVHQKRGDIDTAHYLIQPYLIDAALSPRQRAHVYHIHAIALALGGMTDDAQRAIRQSIDAALTLQDQELLARLYQDQATIAGRIGQLGAAERALRLAERCWHALDDPPALAGTLNARAMLKLALQDYDGAARLALKARAHALKGGRLHTAAIASATSGDIAFAQRQYTEALLHYQVAAEDAEHSGDFSTWTYSLVWQIHSARLLGETARITELLPRLQAHVTESPEDAAWVLTGVAAACLALEEAPPLDDLHHAVEASGSVTEESRISLLIVLAQAYWATGMQTEALTTWTMLEETVHGMHKGTFLRLVPLLTATPALLHTALARETTPLAATTRAILGDQPEQLPALVDAHQHPALRIHVLGEEGVWWHEQPVTVPKQGLLFLVLLLTTSEPVEEQMALDALWGEDDVAVHAIRKLAVRLNAIMPGLIRRSSGHYAVTLPRDKIDLDVWRLFDLDLRTTPTDQLVALADAAMARCLVSTDARWAVELRRRVRRRAAQIWLEIGQRRESGDSQAQHYDAFERAQHADPTSDLVARAVLQQAWRAGDRALLIHRYLRYQRALDDELGVDPAADLQTLYRQALEP